MFLVLGSQGFGQSSSTDQRRSADPSRSEATQEQSIQLSQVPKLARDAAQKALGTTPTEAKVVVGTSPQEYQFYATSKSGKPISVHVLADGKVLKKEREGKEGTGY
jgi:hypothetical protein